MKRNEIYYINKLRDNLFASIMNALFVRKTNWRLIKNVLTKQWPLAPNSRKWRITRANVSNASHIFPEMTFGECQRVRRVRHGILANFANF
jgi:hypothetical protein